MINTQLLITNIIIIAFVGCGSNFRQSVNNGNKVIDSDSVSHGYPRYSMEAQLILKRDSILMQYNSLQRFSVTETIKNGEFSLGIQTICLNDTFDFEYTVDSVRIRPIIEQQKLTFKHLDSMLNSFNVSLPTAAIKNSRGDYVNALRIIIFEASVIKGDKGSIFSIYGCGLCHGSLCPEYLAYYSMDGYLLYEETSNAQELRNLAQIHEIWAQFGIADGFSQETNTITIEVVRFWSGDI